MNLPPSAVFSTRRLCLFRFVNEAENMGLKFVQGFCCARAGE
jgi:hypothetical protein